MQHNIALEVNEMELSTLIRGLAQSIVQDTKKARAAMQRKAHKPGEAAGFAAAGAEAQMLYDKLKKVEDGLKGAKAK